MTFTKDPAPCGSQAAYQRHLYSGDTPCRRCVVANRTYHREYARRYRQRRTPKIGVFVEDIMTTEDRWLTVDVLVALIHDHFPDWRPVSIRKALERHRQAGRLVSRVDPDCPEGRRYVHKWAA